jgi:hypothetical protein
VSTILPIFVLWFSHILTMGVGAYVVTGEYTPTCLIFFYKVLGIVKGMLYLCIVMMKLIDSPTQIKRLNKFMKGKVIDCGVISYYYENLQGYYSLHTNKGDNYTTPHLYLKFNITECTGKRHYGNHEAYPIYRGHRRVRSINNVIGPRVTYDGCKIFLKHFGIKQYELGKTKIVWPTQK